MRSEEVIKKELEYWIGILGDYKPIAISLGDYLLGYIDALKWILEKPRDISYYHKILRKT